MSNSTASDDDTNCVVHHMKQVDNSRRKIYVVRHGERVDFTFGGNWMDNAFIGPNAEYNRFNLNMPVRMPLRSGWPKDFRMDTPLTEVGLHQATVTGEGMKSAGVQISHVFCSPALRCVQTCHNLLTGLGCSDLPIKLETGLFEWPGWFRPTLPQWMTKQELMRFGINIETSYDEIVPRQSFDMTESIQQYYERSHRVADTIQKWLHQQGGNILLVGHGATLDTCTRLLCGHQPRSTPDFYRVLHQVAYTACSCVEECAQAEASSEEGAAAAVSVGGGAGSGEWSIVEPPVPCLSHSANHGLDWRQLI